VVDKIGSTSETWKIKLLPVRATRHTSLHCPACDTLLVSAWPPNVAAYPTATFAADRPGDENTFKFYQMDITLSTA